MLDKKRVEIAIEQIKKKKNKGDWMLGYSISNSGKIAPKLVSSSMIEMGRAYSYAQLLPMGFINDEIYSIPNDELYLICIDNLKKNLIESSIEAIETIGAQSRYDNGTPAFINFKKCVKGLRPYLSTEKLIETFSSSINHELDSLLEKESQVDSRIIKRLNEANTIIDTKV